MTVRQIEIQFPCEVSLPDGWEAAFSALVDMVCKQYERENPTQVMWPAEHGAKPIWKEPAEPEFDHTVYRVGIAVREDYYGNNRHNPERERLRAEARAARAARKKRDSSA